MANKQIKTPITYTFDIFKVTFPNETLEESIKRVCTEMNNDRKYILESYYDANGKDIRWQNELFCNYCMGDYYVIFNNALYCRSNTKKQIHKKKEKNSYYLKK